MFEALLRKEAYATSGTRPELRFFGGWQYADDACGGGDVAKTGYAQGVPMGGEPAGAAGGQPVHRAFS